jgi:hypothetical protein
MKKKIVLLSVFSSLSFLNVSAMEWAPSSVEGITQGLERERAMIRATVGFVSVELDQKIDNDLSQLASLQKENSKKIHSDKK